MIINTSFNQAVEITVIPEEEELKSLDIVYRTIVNECQKKPYLRNLQKLSEKTLVVNEQVGNNKLVTKKMRVKLINWLHKLAIQTFEFASETLLQAIRILDHYLALTNQAPSSLQLVGCACLYISSKISQKKIVAAECYVTACQDLFNQEQLFQKQMTVFKSMRGNPSEYLSLLKFYNFMENKFLLKKQLQEFQSQVQLHLIEFTKKQEYFNSQPLKTVCLLISFALSAKRVPSMEQFTSLIKQGMLQ